MVNCGKSVKWAVVCGWAGFDFEHGHVIALWCSVVKGG